MSRKHQNGNQESSTRLPFQTAVSVVRMWAMFGAGAFLVIELSSCGLSASARHDRYLTAGKSYLEKHDYSRAIIQFKNAMAAMPKDPEAYYEIGVASEASGDIQTSVAGFRKALDLDPKHAGAQLKLAQLMAMTSDQKWLKEAETRLTALQQSDPASVEVLNTLAMTELKLDAPGKAIQNLQRSLAAAPGQLSSSVLLAQAKLAQHDPKSAEEVLKKACGADPTSASPRIVLGEFYLTQQRTAEAETEFRHALSIDSKSGEALLQLANLQWSLGRKQEAEQSYLRLAAFPDARYKPVHAQFLFQEGRRDEAIREFEALAKQNPADRQARTRLVAAYEVVNRIADARNVLARALKKNPKDLDALIQRAEISVRMKNFIQAQNDANEVLHLRPDASQARYVRAQVDRARGQNLLYRQELSDVLRANPEVLGIRIEIAQSLIRDRQAEAALEILNAAPETQRELPPVVAARNWAYWIKGDSQAMRKGIDEGLASGKSSEFLIQDGLWKLGTKNYTGARVSLEEALKIDPADVRALSGLNQTYVAENQPAVGLEKVKEYASHRPESASVQEFLGSMLLQHGEREQARAAFTAAKSASPTSIEPDLYLAQTDILDGKMDAAHKKLENVLAKDSTNVTAAVWLGNLEVTSGNYKAAVEHYRRAADEDSSNTQALNNVAYLLAEYEHQPDAALNYAQKAVELAPATPSYRDTLGWVLYRKSLYAPAVTELESAASKGDKPQWQYHLGMAYIKLGDLKRGRATLEAALKRAPNVPEAKAAQKMLTEGR